MWRRILAFISVCLIVLGCGVTSLAGDTDTTVESFVEDFCANTRCKSVSVAVVDGDAASFYGDADGLYQIGSMTKAFTGLAVQKLISEGRLNEDDLVSDLIPGFTAYYESLAVDITVNHLLNQTGGYTNSESDYPSAEDGMTLMQWAMTISGKELNSYPGSEYAYSNVNYNLLGLIIEQVTGMPYAEYMNEEILNPLDLTNTYVGMPKAEDAIVTGSRVGYRNSFEYEIPVVEGRIPAGYFYSNVRDCARWISIWNGTADIPDEYKELIVTVKEHLEEQGDYYSGWELFEDGVMGHSGGTPNYSSRIVFDDSTGKGVCVLANLNVAASTDGLCNGIFNIISGKEFQDIPTDVWTVFDIIFTIVSGAGILMTLLALLMKKSLPIIISGIVVLLLVVSLCIVLPIVFGAGLAGILFTWAPYSLAGSMLILVIHEIVAVIKLRKMRSNEN